jgi:hypothetical protein
MKLAAMFVLGLVATAGCGDDGGRLVVVAPPPWMDQKVEAQGLTADPAGQRVGDLLRSPIDAKGPVDWLIHLDNAHCYWFSGVASEGIDKLSMYLWDPHNSRASTDRAPTPTVVMKYCPAESGPYRMQAKVHRGGGFVDFGIYAVPGPAGVVTEVGVAKANLDALIDQQAASAAPGAARSGDFFVGTSDKSEWAVALAANTCYWFIGVGEPGKVKELGIYVWDPQQKRVTESHNDNNVAVAGTCATYPGMYKFQAKVKSGGGDYKVGVFAKAQ